MTQVAMVETNVQEELAQLRAEVKALQTSVSELKQCLETSSPTTKSAKPDSASPITLTEFPHIIKVKGKHGGSPLLKESFISVKTVAAFTKMGFTPAQIVAEYIGELNQAEVYEALAYYYRHLDEIEAYLTADENAEAQFRQQPSKQERRP